MDKSKFGERQGENLDAHYQNGQSDAEKLMSSHLRAADDDSLPEEKLRAIRIAGDNTPANTTPAADANASDEDNAEPGPITTPFDILGD